MKFEAILSRFSENSLLWESYIPIPDLIYQEMIQIAPDKRVLCILNDSVQHYCAMLTKNGMHYLLLNKEILKELKESDGTSISVELQKADLKYGIPICKELEEVLAADPEGENYFHALTKGVQRSLIHIINKYKNPQLRIERSILLLHYLVEKEGKLDFKQLMMKFKRGF